MKRLLVMAVLAASVSARAASPNLEIEIGGGANSQSLIAPTFTARLGLDLFEHLTPSVRVITLMPGLSTSAETSWAVLGELRGHTSGRFQLNAGVGLGVGNAVVGPLTDGLAIGG